MSDAPAPASTRVAVLMGGRSAEADVSRSSAREVCTGLRDGGYQAELFELDARLTAALNRFRPDVVFPALHGPVGEDGTVQGYLQILGLPYVGSGVRGSAVAMDKFLAKLIYRQAGLPVAEDWVIEPGADPEKVASALAATFADGMVIKPRSEGSAVGVMRLEPGTAPHAAVATACRWPGGALVEPFLRGMEVTVGVLDFEGETPRASPAIGIETAADEWYDFTNRYAAGKSRHLIPAPLPTRTLAALEQIAITAHQRLGLRDLSRSDFLVDQSQQIFLLETNSLPGMTPTSLYPDGARALGIDFPTLMHKLVRSALARAALAPPPLIG